MAIVKKETIESYIIEVLKPDNTSFKPCRYFNSKYKVGYDNPIKATSYKALESATKALQCGYLRGNIIKLVKTIIWETESLEKEETEIFNRFSLLDIDKEEEIDEEDEDDEDEDEEDDIPF